MNIIEFLDLILPSQGLRCVVAIKGGKPSQRFGPDNAWLAKVGTTLDAAGFETYHACATYRDKSSRTQANAAWVRSFWLDVDAGPGKPFADWKEATRALMAFVTKLGLPQPGVVKSGRGIHVYFVMDADMTPEEWAPVAGLLKLACREAGFHVGAERTADIASILRPPGTTHRKGEPLAVIAFMPPVISTVAAFWDALSACVGSVLPPEVPAHLKGVTLNNDLAAGQEYPPSSAELIADKCPVMAEMRETRGNVDQPTWYGALGVLVHTRDGEDICHEWSDGHPTYSEAETDKKIAQALKFGPTTCAKLSEAQYEKCSACPHYGKLTSPIVLGYEVVEPVVEVEVAPAIAATPTPLRKRALPVEPCQLEFLPKPLQALARSTAELLHAPLDFVLANLIVMAASVISGRVRVNFKRHAMWIVAINIWGMVVAGVSAKKTPSARPAADILHRLEEDDAAQHQNELDAFASAQLAHQHMMAAMTASIKKQAGQVVGQLPAVPHVPAEPERPLQRRRLTSNATYEAVGVMAHRSPGLIVYQDELSGLLSSLCDPKQQAARAFYLTAWNGDQPYQVDRIGRQAPRIDCLNIAIMGNIQPEVLNRLLTRAARDGSGADGLLQRFGWITSPDPLPSVFVDKQSDLRALVEAEDAFKLLRDLDPDQQGAISPMTGGPSYFNLDDDAYGVFLDWNEWRMQVEADEDMSAPYRQHVGKLPKVVAAVAVVIHLMEGGRGPITGPTMARAAAAGRYCASHARRVYAAAFDPSYEPARSIARRISKGEITGTIKPRDAQNKGWAGMETPEDAVAVLNVLEEAGWVHRVEKHATAKGGRPSVTWSVNPLGHGAAWE